MAYTRTSVSRSYIGLSTDWKPHRGVQADGTSVSSTDLPQGSTFTELDTGFTAIYDGYEWMYLPKPNREDVVEKLDDLLGELKLLRELQTKMLLLMAGG